jgi:single-strand DNA-binding protein
MRSSSARCGPRRLCRPANAIDDVNHDEHGDKYVRTTNLFILRGRVGQEPKAFGKTAKLSVATDRGWTDAKGERREETDWVTVTLLNEKIAEWALAHVGKGDAVYAECRIAEGSYKRDGETVYTTDIVANVFHKLDLGVKNDASL